MTPRDNSTRSRGTHAAGSVLPSEPETLWHPEELAERERPFVVNVLEIDRRLGTAHHHSGVEISWIPRGDALFYVEGRYHELQAHDVFFVNPALPHHTGNLSGPTFHIGYAHISTEAVLSIPPISAGLAALQLFHTYSADPGPVVRNRPDICAHLQSACDNYRSTKGDHMRIAAWGDIMKAVWLLLEAVRSPGVSAPTRADPTARTAIHRALEFISVNFNRPITVAGIAEASAMSQSSLSHTFTDVMKCSPIEYRNRMRLNFAMERLLSTNDKIDKIAEDCGFDSATALHNLFNKATGRSPGSFRSNRGIRSTSAA